MLFYIEIAEESLDLIAHLNAGVKPKIENPNDPTFFVYNTEGHNDIISLVEFEKISGDADKATIIPIVALG